MVPKQLAFVLLAVACVAAAGGGAYLATLHDVSPSGAPVSSSAPAESPTAPPVASALSQATIPEVEGRIRRAQARASSAGQPSRREQAVAEAV